LSAASRPPQVGHLWAGVVMDLSMVRAEAPVHTGSEGLGLLSKRVVSTGSDWPCRARPADRCLVAEDRSAGGVRDQTEPGNPAGTGLGPRLVHMPSDPSGLQRYVVSQVASAIQGKQALAEP